MTFALTTNITVLHRTGKGSFRILLIEIISPKQNCGVRLEFEVSEDEQPQCLGGTQLNFFVIDILRGDALKKEITGSFDIAGSGHTLSSRGCWWRR